MNPPSALQGAMGRERKPFTYTPGGLDLSEIKSERMAKRLMRNAMNQGVPELPPQVQSPSTPTNPIAVPNFNCMPVQVFPTINLPANPKSLLRTRSTPERPREPPAPRVPPPTQYVNNFRPTGMEQLRETISNNSYNQKNNLNNNRPLPSFEYNNSRPASMYEFSAPSGPNLANTTYGSDAYTAPVLPEMSYDAQFCTTASNSSSGIKSVKFDAPVNSIYESKIENNITFKPNDIFSINTPSVAIPQSISGEESVKVDVPTKNVIETDVEKEAVKDSSANVSIKSPLPANFPIESLPETESYPAPVQITHAEDIEAYYDDDDQTVKVVKKQVKKKVESDTQQNGNQNGDSEAEMTVKLPTKKAAAKTETKVEVVKKTLPDGSTEETKTTITKTTIDGKTNITTKTEIQIIPKEEEEEEEEYEEVEEEVEEDEVVEEVQENGQQEDTTTVIKKTVTQEAPVVKETIVKKEESSETSTTKKVVVVQSKPEETEEEEEEIEEEEEVEETPTTVVIKKQEVQQESKIEKKDVEEKQIEQVKQQKRNEKEVEEVREKAEVTQQLPESKIEPPKQEDSKREEEEENFEEAVETVEKPEPPQKELAEPVEETKEETEESEYTEEEVEEIEEPVTEKQIPASTPVAALTPVPTAGSSVTPAPAPVAAPAPAPAPASEHEAPKSQPGKDESQEEEKAEELTQPEHKQSETKRPETKQPETKQPEPKQPETKQPEPIQPEPRQEQKVPLREPSIPLEKVEDVEIKPIGAASETISKTHTERTEIISSGGENSAGTLSTQTEYNRIENIVTVNRTTKTLDHSYEQITQQGIPTVKTYFPPGRERVSTSPQPSKPYQTFYTPPPSQPQTERRHSLLLERLSTERQMPSEIYQQQKSYQQQYNNQSYEQQRQWSQEPQSEVVTEGNVKPSSITNQQWYQQSRKENVIYNNVSPSTPAVPSQQWSQPQPQLAPQPQPQPHPQPQFQQQYQPSYTENLLHDSSKISSNTFQQSDYPSYSPAPPSNWASSNVGSNLSNVNTQSNQYSYLNKTSSESYQNTASTQQYSSSYVPPPWEQDPSYVAPQLKLPSQNAYQPPPSTNTFSPNAKPGWKSTPPAGKFSKPVSSSYIPPAPNQSFVKPVNVAEPPKRPGSKTYYSEYERRYITVPESTYIPNDAKFQPQPNPSPQYYYDNNEPPENVEHEWRKELREFTEKTQTQVQTQTQSQIQTQQHQQQFEQTTVNPPWEEDPKYAKVPTVTYNPTPSWSQTLRPQSGRERSFESEYVNSNEWSKTNTLGRSRPLSTYSNSNAEAPLPEKARGVSVDRYNPSKYQSPMTIPYDSEHSPVQAHTLDPTPSPHRGYHNPNVPSYHARASAEPRATINDPDATQLGRFAYNSNPISIVQVPPVDYRH